MILDIQCPSCHYFKIDFDPVKAISCPDCGWSGRLVPRKLGMDGVLIMDVLANEIPQAPCMTNSN